ncbi:hypothetical protein GCM10011383_16540 [Hymenobacter cavernae]|uniref:Uncharacterized protein n=1 Tax=Hymenobacter cavernae TaxID=2044852 RepID=A0ABQ1TZA0_9BACT|nr:hypothetical protein GCM10011383_16540 [Hymenobacter cavernae]
MLSLFQDEAIGADSECENRYADAVKQSAKQGFASAKALAGSFSPIVDQDAHLVEGGVLGRSGKATFVLWTASKKSSG